jgi:hypothetical protein
MVTVPLPLSVTVTFAADKNSAASSIAAISMVIAAPFKPPAKNNNLFRAAFING